MMSFQLFLHGTVCEMAEEFQKYKNILDREKEEFRHQLQREVSSEIRIIVANFENIIARHLFFLKF